MKKVICTLVSLVLIGLAVFFPIKTYNDVIRSPLNKDAGEVIRIDANKGTFSGVMKDNENAFRGHLFIKIFNKLNKVSISVKKGVYEIPNNLSLEELLKALEKGEYNTSILKVTIPEGYTIEQIAKVLDNNDIIAEEEFLKGCKEYILPEYIKRNNKRYDLEGYLFPDTYIFEKGMKASNIIDIMVKRFEEVIKQIEKENGIFVESDKLEEVVIKASIIEREVSLAKEKKTVASVIENRLKKGMKLQIDATVLYALGEHKNKVMLSDLKYPSNYNTYYIEGLPIGAISNPGKDSLEAAILPESTKYLYYMTKDGSNHRFFETYNEFLKYKNSK